MLTNYFDSIIGEKQNLNGLIIKKKLIRYTSLYLTLTQDYVFFSDIIF